jgi:hypothetical protein
MTRKARRTKLQQRAVVSAIVASTTLAARPARGRELIDLLRHSETLEVSLEGAAHRFDIPPGSPTCPQRFFCPRLRSTTAESCRSRTPTAFAA